VATGCSKDTQLLRCFSGASQHGDLTGSGFEQPLLSDFFEDLSQH